MKAIEKKRCARCQKTFRTRHGSEKFCSKICAKSFYKPNENTRKYDIEGRIFPSKETIAKHYNTEIDKCMACGVKCTTDRAHIVPYAEGGHALENLSLLCKTCHTESEGLEIEVYREWMNYKRNAYKDGRLLSFCVDTKIALIMLNAIHLSYSGKTTHIPFQYDEFYSDYINEKCPNDVARAEDKLIAYLQMKCLGEGEI